MFVANLAALTLSHVSAVAAWFLQEQPVGWDPISLWHQMGILAKAVVLILFVMSGWSIGVMIDRAMAFSAARKQSRAFAPAVAGALRDGKIDEAWRSWRRSLELSDQYLAPILLQSTQQLGPRDIMERVLPDRDWPARKARGHVDLRHGPRERVRDPDRARVSRHPERPRAHPQEAP